jgi:glutaredoxin
MSQKYTIYGMPGCSACTAAKAAVEQKNAPHEYIDVVAANYTAIALQAELGGINTRTLPQIVVTDDEGVMTYVGGLPDLREHLKTVSL